MMSLGYIDAEALIVMTCPQPILLKSERNFYLMIDGTHHSGIFLKLLWQA